jgi:hypothetical protein
MLFHSDGRSFWHRRGIQSIEQEQDQVRQSNWGPAPDVRNCDHEVTPPEYVWKVDDESELKARPMRIQRCVKCTVRVVWILDSLKDINP